jgi:hypothetical protein
VEHFIVYWVARISHLQEMRPDAPRPVRVPK